jgi:hypothetical protein
MRPDEVQGALALIDWFGSWPSFHDAEILDLHLDRGGASRLRVHVWIMTNKTGADGHFINEKHCVVSFVFDEITDLDLGGFSPQNVINGLSLTAAAEGFELVLQPCYGLSGRLVGTGLRIELSYGYA